MFSTSILSNKKLGLLAIFGLVLGWSTIFRGYESPAAFFWDENYHVASAQKYLNHVFFQEPHPPLGKLLIAAGEGIFKANERNDSFINTNHASEPPANFSFEGYRFFPVLLATLSVPLFGILGARLGGSWLAGVLCSAAFGLDNALVVHLRGAMLEGPQLFFLLSSAVALLFAYPSLAGLAAGAALATKFNSAPAVLLIALSIFFTQTTELKILSAQHVKTLFRFLAFAALLWLATWQLHFTLGQKLQGDTYKAPQSYQTALREGRAGELALFPEALKQSLSFFADYQTGVPALNMCKVAENGGYPLLWPLGTQSINYRWERKDEAVGYLYLQANPAVWLFSLCGILWGVLSIFNSVFNASYTWASIRSITFKNGNLKNGALVLLYGASIFLPLYYARVFYLYHFFVPLLCGVLLSAGRIASLEARTQKISLYLVLFISLTFFASFRYFSPLTYAVPITDQQLAARAWLSLWNLRCANCEAVFPIARPEISDRSDVSISGYRAVSVSQGYGRTRMGLTDEGAPLIVARRLFQFGIGTHANGEMVFTVPRGASVFSVYVGVPDAYLKRKTSVRYAILVDGILQWESAVMRPEEQALPAVIPVTPDQKITLRISDANDGITDDHGAWLEPTFK